jgi:hypothetical protein
LGSTVTCSRGRHFDHVTKAQKASQARTAGPTGDMSLFTQHSSQSTIATTPGDLLLRLNDTRNAGVFSSFVLEKYLCPALDALPADQRANLFAILQEAERATEDVSSHFGKLHLSGEDSDDDCYSSSDDDYVPDPRKMSSEQIMERRYRTDALIRADAVGMASASEFDKDVLSWLPFLWHLEVEGATNTGEILAALQLCAVIRYVKYARRVSISGS